MPTSYAEAREAARAMTPQEVDETLNTLFDATIGMFAATTTVFRGTTYEGYVNNVVDQVTNALEHIADVYLESEPANEPNEPALSR